MKRLGKYITESILDTTMDHNVLVDIFKDGIVTKDAANEVFPPDMDEIVLPEGIVELGINSFADRDNLKRVVLPSTLTKIGSGSFNLCKNLEEVVFHPKTRNLKVIEDLVFGFCYSLTKLDLPDCIEMIGYNVFYGIKVTAFHVPTNLKVVGHNTFEGMEYVKKLDLSRTKIAKVEPYMFTYCETLEEVILPRTCTAIGEEAFSKCGNLKVVWAPEVRKIGEQAFYGCEKLTTLDIEYSRGLSIDKLAFSGCSSLVNFPVPISTAKDYAFSGCDDIEEITWTGKGELDASIARRRDGRVNSLKRINVLVPKERLAPWALKCAVGFGSWIRFVFPDK